MTVKIAVILDEEERLATFEDGKVLRIFYKDSGIWELEKEVGYSLDTFLSLSDIRNNIRSIISELEDCRIIAGKTVTGLPYNVLDRIGFEIYEADTLSEALLDGIIQELEDIEIEKSNKQTPMAPVPTETEGVYFLNLIELQESHPEVSSKKALQPFIETNLFYKLEVIVSHVPPWFDSFLPARNLTYKLIELDKNLYKAVISKKLCSC